MVVSDLDTDADGINTVFMPDERHSPRSLLNAINRASATARNGWLALLALMAWLALALAGVSAADLLLDAPVTLPLLGVEISLASFFLFAPLLLIFVHVGVLLQHVMLARKISVLEEQIAEGPDEEIHPLRNELHAYLFTQMMAGPPRSLLFTFTLDAMLWLSLSALPVLLLLFFQASFLPVHDVAMTWLHRLFVLFDVGVLLMIGLFLRAPDVGLVRALTQAFWRRPLRTLSGGAGAVLVLFFSVVVLTIPGERMERLVLAVLPNHLLRDLPTAGPGAASARADGDYGRRAFVLTAILLEDAADGDGGHGLWSAGGLRRNLRVTDHDLTAGGGDAGLSGGGVRRSLRGRDLRFARLDRSNLRGVDFSGADLTGASLREANLSRARFSCLNRKGVASGETPTLSACASLAQAVLVGADLSHAELRGANLRQADLGEAKLVGADLYRARLVGARLAMADLRGASLRRADLRGADLSWAKLAGANIGGARLQAASLKGADLTGASLALSALQGADLSDAILNGSDLHKAHLFAADLSRVGGAAVNLRGASVWRTVPPTADGVPHAGLDDLRIAAPDAEGVRRLKTALADVKQTALGARLLTMLENPGGGDWARSSAHDRWLALRNQVTQDAQGGGSVALLANLVCDDASRAGYVGNAVVRRMLVQGSDTAIAALMQRLRAADCLGRAAVEAALLSRLTARARSVERVTQRREQSAPRQEPSPPAAVEPPAAGQPAAASEATVATEADLNTTSGN